MSRIAKAAVAFAGAAVALVASIVVPLVVRRGRRDPLSSRVRTALAEVYDRADTLIIRAERDVVTLRGEVSNLQDIERLERVARAVPGVADVDNLLRLELAGLATRPRVLSA